MSPQPLAYRARTSGDRPCTEIAPHPEPSRKDVPHRLTTCKILNTVVHYPFAVLPLAAASNGQASKAIVPSLSQLSDVDVQDDFEVLLAHRRSDAPTQHQNGYPLVTGDGAIGIGPGSSASGGAYDRPIPAPPSPSPSPPVPVLAFTAAAGASPNFGNTPTCALYHRCTP